MFVYDQIYALQEENTTGSDTHSFGATQAVAGIYC